MSIWSGYLGLAVGYVILAAVLLWIVISMRGRMVLKTVLIATTIWYGAVLYYTAGNLMGWPVHRNIPEDSRILAMRIREPEPARNDPGAIFLWISNGELVSGDSTKSESFPLNPKALFGYHDAQAPRAFRLPYSRQMHKELNQVQKEASKQPGAVVLFRKKGLSRFNSPGEEESRSPAHFEILNPVSRLPAKNYGYPLN